MALLSLEQVREGLAEPSILPQNLDFARRERIVVRGYIDRIEGTLGKDIDGAVAMTRVVLRPTADCDADLPTLKKLHDRAHHACFIANSVRSEVVVEPRLYFENQE